MFICGLLNAPAIEAQSKKNNIDSSITFKVFGACSMCKDRIEAASKGRGG